MNIIRLCGIAILAVAATVTIRAIKPDFAVFVGAAAAVVLLGASVSALAPFVGYVEEAAEGSGISVYFSTILKALGITVIAQMTSDICRDCGEGAVASKIEFAAKCAILLLGLPVIKNVIELSKTVLEL